MKILITGGLGYLGGRLARTLLAHTNYEVFLGSRTTCKYPEWSKMATVVNTDWELDSSLDRLTASIDCVVHLAGMNAQDCAADPVAALKCNGLNTARLLQSAIRQGVKRFVYLSTAHVYKSPLTGLISEQTCPISRHPYATSHRAGEDVVLAAHHNDKIEGVVIRLSNAFGAPAHKNVNCWMLLVNDLCWQAITTNKMVLRSSGQQRRDFIALSDVCRAIWHLLEVPAAKLGAGLFNVGAAWSPSVLEMTQLLAQRINAVKGSVPDIIVNGSDSSNAEYIMEYSVQKLLETGFESANDIKMELDGLIEFCLKNIDGIAP